MENPDFESSPFNIPDVDPADKEWLELIKSEVEEWSNIMEQATTPESRRQIVTSLLILSSMEQSVINLQNNLDNGKHSTDKPGLERVKQSIKRAHKDINKIRVTFGLPPKYTEESQT